MPSVMSRPGLAPRQRRPLWPIACGLLLWAGAQASVVAAPATRLEAGPPTARAGTGSVATPWAVGAVPLQNGVALPVAGAPDEKRFFTIDVPEGAGLLTLALAGDKGEVDLFVGAPGRPASFLHHDCISSASGANELCTSYNPAPGRYTALLYDGYKGYRNASLKATYQLGAHHGPDAPALADGVPLLVSGRKGEEQLYKIDAPAGAYRLTVGTAGGRGDVDLAMRFEETPDADANRCSDFGGPSALCDQGFPTPGTWYVKLSGAKAFSGVELTATLHAPAPMTLLQNGVTLPGLSAECCEMQYYRIEVPEGAGQLTVKTGGDRDGDLSLYLGHGDVPRWFAYDCASEHFGEAETCVIPTPQAGTWYIGLLSHFNYADVPLAASYTLGGGGYTGPDCPAGATQRTGTLYRGQTVSYPFKSPGGRIGAKLAVSAQAIQNQDFPMDFDLYLEQRVGGAWQVLASSAGTSQFREQLGLAQAPAGALRWTVAAFEGSGSFRLCAAAGE